MDRVNAKDIKLDSPAMCNAPSSNGQVIGDAITPLSYSHGRTLGGLTPLSCGIMKSGNRRRSAIRDYPECLLKSVKTTVTLEDNHNQYTSLNKLRGSINAPGNAADNREKFISYETGNLTDKFNKVSFEPVKATNELGEHLHQPEKISEIPEKCLHKPEMSVENNPEKVVIKHKNLVNRRKKVVRDFPDIRPKLRDANPSQEIVVRDFPDIVPKSTCLQIVAVGDNDAVKGMKMQISTDAIPTNNPSTEVNHKSLQDAHVEKSLSSSLDVVTMEAHMGQIVAIGDSDVVKGMKMQISTNAIQTNNPSTEVDHKSLQVAHVEKMSSNLDVVNMDTHMGQSSPAIPTKENEQENIQKAVSLAKNENPTNVKDEIASPNSELNQHMVQKLQLGNEVKQVQQMKRKSGIRDFPKMVKLPKPIHSNARMDTGKILKATEIYQGKSSGYVNGMDCGERDHVKSGITAKNCELTPSLKHIGFESAKTTNIDVYSSKRKSPEETLDNMRSKKIGKSKRPDCVLSGKEVGISCPVAPRAQEISPIMSNKSIKISTSPESSKKNRQSTAIVVAVKPMDKARKTIIESMKLFDSLRRKFLQDEEKNVKQDKPSRAHNQASTMIREHAFIRSEKVKGSIPGIDVGTIFFFRMEMSLLGFHGPIQGGIEFLTAKETPWNTPIAISIISNVGQDGEDNGYQLIYNGQGGRNAENKEIVKDQKLERGNLAMDGSRKFNVPVRLTRGVKDPNSPSTRVYVYDGLYAVVETFTVKSTSGFSEYRFKLVRLPDQPPIPSNQLQIASVLKNQSPSSRSGVIMSDISRGREQQPVCVENTVDDDHVLVPFEYITKVKYPNSIQKFDLPPGCNCKGACTALNDCRCFLANGEDLPYLNGGFLVREKDYVFECGNQCLCSSNCKNRLTNNGMKYRLDVFKTLNRGWGVRALELLPAGSFVCEYAGRMVIDPEMMKISSRKEYALDLRRVHVKRPRWGDVPDYFPDRAPSDIMPHYGNPNIVIDASTQGNVARFINHSCSPNLLMQKVLSDHHDPRFPRIAFFAMENILPMTELTFDYGPPSDGDQSLICLCGSSECRGLV